MKNFLEFLGYESPEKRKQREKDEKLAKLRQELMSLEQWLGNVEMGTQMNSGGSGELRSADSIQIQRIKNLIDVKKQEIAKLEGPDLEIVARGQGGSKLEKEQPKKPNLEIVK